MDSMLERIEALERQNRTVARRLHLWRGLACALVVLGLLTWSLPSVIAQDARTKKKDLEARVAALEDLLKHFTREGNEVFITGANLHIVNGLGHTDCVDGTGNEIPDCPNGLGNLIVGYNEDPPSEFPPIRAGSHTIVVGMENNFSRVGGIVIGRFNAVHGDFATVSGGRGNTASGGSASVSGGDGNTATGTFSSVSGGFSNSATGAFASVSGGTANLAIGGASSVSGGFENEAEGIESSVSGGEINSADALRSPISGGAGRGVHEPNGWAAGSAGDEVSGSFRSP